YAIPCVKGRPDRGGRGNERPIMNRQHRNHRFKRRTRLKVLVTGGAGYIGTAVVEELLAEQHTPIVYDNLVAGHAEAVPRGIAFVKAISSRANCWRELCANMESRRSFTWRHSCSQMSR